MSDAHKLEIEATIVEHCKEYPEYHGELREYAAGAFLTCFYEVTWAMIKTGVDIALPILAELRSSFIPSEPSY